MVGSSLEASGKKVIGDFHKWQGDAEERELDQASLGELVRRGWRTGGRIASGIRPLGSSTTTKQSSSLTSEGTFEHEEKKDGGIVDVWEKPRSRFFALAQRAMHGMERLVVSEVLDNIRPYAQRYVIMTT